MTNLSEKKGGGLIYNPPMMEFDGSTSDYIHSSHTTTGNKVTVLLRFNASSFTGDTFEVLFRCDATTGVQRFDIVAFSSDYTVQADKADTVQFRSKNTSGTDICMLFADGILDGNNHVVLYSFDGDAGTATLIIDGQPVDDANTYRVAPTTGTLGTGATSITSVGATTGSVFWFNGKIGFCGYADQYLTNWQDFMHNAALGGGPKQQDFSVSWANTGWGSQPLFWHPGGKMDENKGSAGAMTKNGTITLADVDYVPMIGLPTIGTAENHHIKTSKVAWVDGVEKVGAGYFPAMMQFDGSTGYYSDASVTPSGNKLTFVCRFSSSSFTTSGRYIAHYRSGTNIGMFSIVIMASDAANAVEQNKIQVLVLASNGSSWGHRVFSESVVTDGEPHTVHYEYDGDAGTGTLVVDGVAEDQTDAPQRVAANAQTLTPGSGSFWVGSANLGASLLNGRIGFIGFDDAAATSSTDFMQTDGTPKPLDESTWTEWGAQPLFWNEHGDMVNNLGSAGAMTKNGTINVASAQ